MSVVWSLTILLFATASHAGEHSFQDLLKEGLKAKLGAPSSRIEFSGPIRWTKGEAAAEISKVEVLAVNSRGEAQFVARGGETASVSATVSEGTVAYSAWVPARVATRRVLPGELIQADGFMTQDLNIATGQNFELRGTILPGDTDIAGLEARQTILEGQFLASHAVKKVPDVRRGDVVRIHLISNGVTLSTLGVAEEPGYLNSQLRVMTQKSKRELLGQLSPGRIVEVKL